MNVAEYKSTDRHLKTKWKRFGVLELFEISVLLACFVALVVCLSGLHKGFDITDESFYCLQALSCKDYPLRTSSFGYLLHYLPVLGQSQLYSLRLWHLIGITFSSLFLSAGLSKYLVHNLNIRKIVPGVPGLHVFFCTCLLGNLLAFAFFPRALSYNGLCTILSQSAFASLLLGQSSQRSNLAKYSFFTFTGVLLGLLFFNKITACLSVLFLLACFLVVNGNFKGLLPILAGAGFGAAFFLIFLQDPNVWWQGIIAEIGQQSSTSLKSHSMSKLLRLSLESILNMAADLNRNFAWFFLATFGCFLARKKFERKETIVCFCAVFACLLFALQLVMAGYWQHGLRSSYGYYAILLMQTLLFILFCQTSGKKICALFTCLALLPLACTVGTSNPLMFQTIVYFGSFTLSGLLLLLLSSQNRILRLMNFVLAASTVSLASYHFITGYLDFPYALQEKLHRQKRELNRTDFPFMAGIRLSDRKAAFVTEIRRLLVCNGYKPGDTILCFYNLPGVVYALQGSSVGASWYTNYPGESATVLSSLSKLRRVRQKRVFMLLTWRLDEAVSDCLKREGMSFPEQFRKIGEIENPFLDPIHEGFPDSPDKALFLGGKTEVYKFSPADGLDDLSGKNVFQP
jgi:hypothetical protein